MTSKYCDHGLYGAATFVASTSGSSTLLTIASISAGTISVGQLLSGAGITVGTWVTAVTYTGNVPTSLTMSVAMTVPAATTVTGSYGNIATIPSWGVAQDGDGTSSGVASDAAVSIDLSAATAAAGATFQLMGAVLTCVASGAVANQFNAGAGSALVTSLVAAINRTTNTSTIAAQAAGWATPKVQDAVFARANATPTTLDIMTRAGSAQYNSSTVTTAGFTGGTFGPYTFSGGLGGAWGYLANFSGASNASALTYGTYGIWCANTALAGLISPGDVVNIRAGKNVPLPGPASYNPLLLLPAMGTMNNYVTMLVDDSTIWSDGTDPVLQLTLISVSNSGIQFGCSPTSYVVWKAGFRVADNFQALKLVSNGGGSVGITVIAGTRVIDGLYIEPYSSNNIQPIQFVASYGWQVGVRNLKVRVNTLPFMSHTSNQTWHSRMENIWIDNTGNASAHAGVLGMAATAACSLEIDGLKLTNFVTGSALIQGAQLLKRFKFTNVEFGNVTAYGAKFCQIASGVGLDEYAETCSISNPNSDNYFALDTRRGFCEWNPLRTTPHLNAVLPSGTGWALRAFPTTVANTLSQETPFRLPEFRKYNTLADGARTFKVELLAKTGLNPTTAMIWAVVTYVNTSGTTVKVSSFSSAASALAGSTPGWSATTFDDGGVINFTGYKIEIPTPAANNLKTGTNVSCTVCLAYTAADITQMVFVDPDIGIA